MGTRTIPVHSDCPKCPECRFPGASPAALEPDDGKVPANLLRCPACGHQWEEADLSKVAHAWWAAGGWEVMQRDNGQDCMSWKDVALRLP